MKNKNLHRSTAVLFNTRIKRRRKNQNKAWGHCGHCVTVIVEDHRDLDRVTVATHWTHCATPRARGPDVKVDTRIRHHVRLYYILKWMKWKGNDDLLMYFRYFWCQLQRFRVNQPILNGQVRSSNIIYILHLNFHQQATSAIWTPGKAQHDSQVRKTVLCS